MGKLGEVDLPIRHVLVVVGAVLAIAPTGGIAYAGSPSPAPDPAPVQTTTTKTTTTRVTTTRQRTAPVPTRTRTTTQTVTHTQTHSTPRTTTRKTQPVTHKSVTKIVHTVKQPKLRPQPTTAHKPVSILPGPPKTATTPAAPQAAPAVAVSATAGVTSSRGNDSQRLERMLLVIAALTLLALSLVPTRVVVSYSRLEPAKTAAVKMGLAFAGLSIGAGFLITMLLSKSA